MLRSNEKFASEAGFGGAALQGFFGGEAHEIGIVVFLGNMGEDEVARDGVETFGIAEILAHGVIGKMAGAGEHTLFDDPGVGTDFQHVEIVIGFENQTIGAAEMDFDEFRHVAEIGDDRHFRAVRLESETDGIGSVMRDGKSMDVDVANRKMLAGMNRFDATEALGKSFGEDALHGPQSGLGDVERGFPKAEHLREAVAVVGVFVGDENTVEMFDCFFDGGEAGESFALTEAGVHEEAGALSLEQRDIARAAGGQNGYPQADRSLLNLPY